VHFSFSTWSTFDTGKTLASGIRVQEERRIKGLWFIGVKRHPIVDMLSLTNDVALTTSIYEII
jgi:hypothetical protein